jgi:hypothetical protein
MWPTKHALLALLVLTQAHNLSFSCLGFHSHLREETSTRVIWVLAWKKLSKQLLKKDGPKWRRPEISSFSQMP